MTSPTQVHNMAKKTKAVVDYQKISHQGLHPNNRHQGRYDLPQLIKQLPALAQFVQHNPKGEPTIDFSNPLAVKTLNQALLASDYGISFWDLPPHNLCPPIPGRVDYLHHLASLLTADGIEPQEIKALDIGTGASCIYPILGVAEYQWQFVASDIAADSLKIAQLIVENNSKLKHRIKLRQQSQTTQIFKGIIQTNERYHLSMCNPPFHANAEEAASGSQRKQQNLAKNQQKRRGKLITANPIANSLMAKSQSKQGLNFSGQSNELWCEGGEIAFLKTMAQESQQFKKQVLWFSSLVSKSDNLRPLRQQLTKLGAQAIRVIEMKQGNKITRILAWSYFDPEQRLTQANSF